MSKATISLRKARDLKKGDVFRLHVHGEVVSADLVADGKLVKVRIALEDRGPRATSGGLGRAAAADAWQPDLEFVDFSASRAAGSISSSGTQTATTSSRIRAR